MAFKMKNPSVAKLVKNASDNRKNKGQYSYYYHKKPDTLKTQPAKGMRSSNPSQTLALPRKNKTTKTFENISTLSTLVGFFKVMFMNVLDAKNAMDDLFWLVKNLLFVRWAQLEHEKTNRERIKKTKT